MSSQTGLLVARGSPDCATVQFMGSSNIWRGQGRLESRFQIPHLTRSRYHVLSSPVMNLHLGRASVALEAKIMLPYMETPNLIGQIRPGVYFRLLNTAPRRFPASMRRIQQHLRLRHGTRADAVSTADPPSSADQYNRVMQE